MSNYATKNIRIKILLNNDKFLSGDINIVGFERFSDFINSNNDSHIRIKNVIMNGKNYNFMLLNKSNVIGYFEEE